MHVFPGKYSGMVELIKSHVWTTESRTAFVSSNNSTVHCTFPHSLLLAVSYFKYDLIWPQVILKCSSTKRATWTVIPTTTRNQQQPPACLCVSLSVQVIHMISSNAWMFITMAMPHESSWGLFWRQRPVLNVSLWLETERVSLDTSTHICKYLI